MKSRSVAIFLVAVLAMTLPATSQDKKPINAKCPVKGQPIKAGLTADFEGKVIGFC